MLAGPMAMSPQIIDAVMEKMFAARVSSISHTGGTGLQMVALCCCGIQLQIARRPIMVG